MKPRRVAALGTALLLLTGCASGVVSGRGSALPPSAGSSGPGGFPSTTSGPSTSGPSTTGPSTSGSSAGGPSAPSGGSSAGRVAAPDGSFSVVVPAGWHEDRAFAQKYQLAEVYLGPSTNGFAANVNVVREAAGSLSLNQYLQQALTKLRRQLAVRNLSSPRSTTVDGEPALTYTFDDTQSGYSLRQAQVVVLHAGSAYVVTYTAVSGAPYVTSAPAVRAIKDSWRWS